MKYFSWLWNNSRGIRWNTVVRIVTGIVQVVLSLLMVWPFLRPIGIMFASKITQWEG